MINYRGYFFAGICRVLRPANLEELEKYKPKAIERDDAGQLRRTKNNRGRYWTCSCTCCGEIFVVRGDNLRAKKHQCPVKQTE